MTRISPKNTQYFPSPESKGGWQFLDKKIDKIRAKLEIDRRKVYSDKVTAKILNGEKNWYVPKNTATRGDVLEIVVNYYLDHVE